VLPHPDHADWFDLSFIYWGFRGHESVESAALRVLTDFCDHNPTVVALSPFELFPAVSPHDPEWLDRMDHLRELLLLAEPLDVTRTLSRCLNVVSTLQGCQHVRYFPGRVVTFHRFILPTSVVTPMPAPPPLESVVIGSASSSLDLSRGLVFLDHSARIEGSAHHFLDSIPFGILLR
jgi:hypothetical protein